MNSVRLTGMCVCAVVSASLLAAEYTGPKCRYAVGEGAIQDGRPSVRWRGFNLLEMFIKGHKNAKPKEFVESDFRMMRDWGFNFARLPMDYRFWIKDGDWEKIDEDVVAYIDRAIALGKKYGVHVQVCMHRCPGWTVARPKEEKDLFTDPDAQRVCALHWSFFAKRWKGIPNEELSFNLFNEPPGFDEAPTYGQVAKMLVDAIRAEDPTRFIMADGIGYGRGPVKSLYGIAGLGQATRGYTPMSVSHYLAPWVGTPSAKPVWPLSLDTPAGILAGKGKADMHTTLEILDVPPCRATIGYGNVSGRVTVRFAADGVPLKDVTLEPKQGAPDWGNVRYYPEWHVSQGCYKGTTPLDLPKGAKRLTAEVVAGDWINIGSVELVSADGRTARLPFDTGWGKPRNFRQRFVGFDAAGPFAFVVADAATRPRRYDDPGREYLYHRVLAQWDEALANGTFAMAGEFGVWKMTPHDITLDIFEDYLALWKERNMGWALWNLRGTNGILDSERADVDYEIFEGHKLDRKMLDLLRRY